MSVLKPCIYHARISTAILMSTLKFTNSVCIFCPSCSALGSKESSLRPNSHTCITELALGRAGVLHG